MDDDLFDRTYQFALAVVRLTRSLPSSPEAWNVRNQLSRCGPSVAANYRAARRGRSRREFLSRLGVVEEEADESCFWLQFVIDSELLPAARVEAVLQEAKELTAIIVASRKTTRENM
jgi:four helix bundle protein